MTRSNHRGAFCPATILAGLLMLLAGCGGGGGGSASSNDSSAPPVSGPPSGKTGTVGLVITDGIEQDYDKILLNITRVDLLGEIGRASCRERVFVGV